MPKTNKNENISKQLTSGNNVTFTLNMDPSTAKRYESSGQYGNKVSYGYFCKDDKMFFATEILHDRLQKYGKGDTVTVSFNDKKWDVSSDAMPQNRELEKLVNDTETTILLRTIAMDIKTIKSHLFGTQNAKQEELPGDEDEDISF